MHLKNTKHKTLKMDDRYIKTLQSEFKPPTVSKSFFPIRHTKPIRELTANSLIDDFYSNILEWNDANVYFSIDNNVFVHDFYKNRTKKLLSYKKYAINSIKEVTKGICIGTMDGVLSCNNLETKKAYRWKLHSSRIGVIDSYQDLIFTGSRDRAIKCLDLRCKKVAYSFYGHTQEVCGLKISNDGRYVATGGNDNKLLIHDRRMYGVPLRKINDHVAAVKAISWCPSDNNILVSGGGTACKTIKMWNVNDLDPIQSIDANSQVCSLYWTKNNQILSTHGYSQNEIRVMKASNLEVRDIYKAHRSRVLHFAIQEDEEYFVTGSGDSEIYFWRYGNGVDLQVNLR